VRRNDPFRWLRQRRDRRAALRKKLRHEPVGFRQPLDLDGRRLDGVPNALEPIEHLGLGRPKRPLVSQLEVPTENPQRRDKRGSAAAENDDLQYEKI